jgi:hypothetical protein
VSRFTVILAGLTEHTHGTVNFVESKVTGIDRSFRLYVYSCMK